MQATKVKMAGTGRDYVYVVQGKGLPGRAPSAPDLTKRDSDPNFQVKRF